jgi:phage-related protein
MAEVVGRAVIEILPDFTKFRAEMQQSVQSLTTDVAKQMSSPRLTQGMEQAVVKSVSKAEKELGRLGDPAIWTRLTQGSEKAADAVARSAQDGAGRAERAWKGVGDGVWTPFGQKAAAAAESVTREFSENAKQSESALSKIANSDAWSKIKANARSAAEGFESAFRESAADAERAVKGVDDTAKGLSLGKVVGGAALLGGATAGFFALKGAISESITAQQESARIGRITESVIQSTGGAANLSAEQVDKLAVSLSQKTGVDDEAIKSGQNVLLTFTKVRDEAGAGNDIFTRASAAALDLSTVLGSDLSGANLQLGKALNDPIKGVAALGRAGVQFTKEQKEQIKTLVESGDILSAQKMILAEVETQVGGAAAAAADPIARLKVTVDNLKESFGAGLLPIVSVAADTLGTLGEAIGPGLQELGAALGQALSPLLEIVTPLASTFIESFAGILVGIAPGLEALAGAFAETFSTLGPVIMETFGVIGSAIGEVLPIFTPLIGIFGNLLQTLLPPLVQVFTVFAEVLADVLGPVLDTLGPLLRQMAEALGTGLTQVLVVAAPYLEQFAETLGGALAGAISTILPALIEMGRVFFDALAQVLPIVLPLFSQLASTLAGMFAGALSQILPLLAQVATQFIQALVPVLPQLSQAIITLVQAMLPLLPAMVDLLGVALQLVPPLVSLVTEVITFADEAGILTPIVGALFAAFATTKGLQAIAPQFDAIKNATKGAKDGIGLVKDNLAKFGGEDATALDGLKKGFSTVGDMVKTAATKMGLLTAATGAQTTATAVQTGATTTATGAQTGLNAAMAANPIGLIVLAVAAVAAGFALLYTKVQPVRDFFDGIGTFFQDTLWPILQNIASVVGGALATAWDSLWPIIQKVGDILKGLYIQPIIDAFGVLTSLFTGDFSGALEKVKGLFGNLGETFGNIGDLAGSLISALWSGLQAVGEWLLSTGLPWLGEKFMDFVTQIPGWLGDLGGLLLGWIGDAFGWLVENLPGIVSTLANWWLNLHLWVLEKLGDLASGLLGWIGSAFSWVAEHAVEAAGVLIGWMIDLPFLLIQGLLNFAELLFGWLSSAFSFIVERGPEILATIGGWLAGIPGQIIGWLGDLGGLLVGWVKGAWDWIVTNGPVILETVLGWWVGMPGMILGWLGDLGSLLLGWVQGAWNWIVTNGPIILTSVLGWFTSIPGQVMSAIGDIGSKLFDWAKAGFQFVADKGPELIAGVVDFFRSIPGRLFDALTGAIGAVGGFASDVGSRIWNSVKGFLNDKLIRPLKDKEVSAFGITLKPFGFLRELAEGGIIRVPTPAIVGEAGPEVVIPLTDPDRAKELVMQSGLIGLISGTPTAGIGAAMPAAVGAAAAMPNVGLAVTPPDTGVNPAPITAATTGAMEAVATSALGALQPVAEWFTTAPATAAAAMAPFGATVWASSAEGFVFLRDQIFATVLTPITDYITNWSVVIGTILLPFGVTVWTAMAAGMAFFRAQFEGVFAGIGSYLNTWLQSIRDGFTSLPTFMSGIAQQITAALKAPFTGFASGTWNPFASALNTALKQIPATAGITIPSLPTAHSGGIIGERLPQTGGPLASDEMVVKMQRGEGVIPADVMRDMTPGEFEAIRSGGGLVMAKPQTDAYVRVPGTGQPYGPVVPAAQGMAATGFVDASVMTNLKAKVAEVQGSIRSLLSGFYMPRFLGGITSTMVDESVKFVEAKAAEQNKKAMDAIGAGDAFPGGLPVGLDGAIARVASMRGISGSYRALIDYIRATGVPHVITSTVRPGSRVRGSGNVSLHSLSRAIDIAGPSGGRDTPEMLRIYRAFAPVRNLLAEIIYSGPGGNYFGRSGVTADDHHDHVHVGLANGGIITSPMSALLGEAGPEVVLPLTRPMRALQLAQESGLMDVLAGAAPNAPNAPSAVQAAAETGPFPGAGNTYNIYGVGMQQVIAEIRAREEAAARTRMVRR